jgi:tocopherol cyclase
MSNSLSKLKTIETPHSGYHWDGGSRRFFEGWYYRITLPTRGQSFAFMYSIEDPRGGQPYSGGAAQILGPEDSYLCRTFPDVNKFWAHRESLGFGHWGRTDLPIKPQYLEPQVFDSRVEEGYQATATLIKVISTIREAVAAVFGNTKFNLFTAGATQSNSRNPRREWYLFYPYLNRDGKF